VKEQSHKNEMSAAIRGDFRRLRERGVAATLAPRDDDVPEPDEIAPESQEPMPTAAAPEPVELAPEPEEPAVTTLATTPAEPDVTDEAVDVDEPGDAESPGFFSRLFGR
jgi:hypothetical protein